jgi:hypothetical protein
MASESSIRSNFVSQVTFATVKPGRRAVKATSRSVTVTSAPSAKDTVTKSDYKPRKAFRQAKTDNSSLPALVDTSVET